MKKEVIAFILFIIGIFLLGSSPSPTGAVIGIPILTSNFIGFILFIVSLILLVREEGGLEKTIKKKLINVKGNITETKDLIRMLEKAGIKVERSGLIRYEGHLLGAIPAENKYIDPNTSRKIIKKANEYIKKEY